MARFTTAGGSGDGTPGATGPQGPAGNDGAQGPQGETGPLPFTYQGDFDYGVTYGTNDAVTFDGGLWKLNNFIGAAGYAPTPGQWTLIIPAGEQGLQGETGPQGEPGTDATGGVVYLGNYVSGNGYIANIAVVRGSDNNLYIAKSNGGLGDPVGNIAEWDIFSDNTTGSGSNTGDITFANNTISSDTGDDIIIQNKDNSNIVKARIVLDQSNEQVLLEAINSSSSTFTTADWTTATWSQNVIQINGTENGVIPFFSGLNGNVTHIQINNGEIVQYDGASYGPTDLTMYTITNAPVESDPVTITSLILIYGVTSKIDISYDNEEFLLQSNGMNLNLSSDQEINLDSDDDVDLSATNRVRIYGDTNVFINSSNGGEYLGNSVDDDFGNQIATVGNLNSTVSTDMVRFVPNFSATGLEFTGYDETYPTYNSYYAKSGKMVSFVIEVDLSTVTNFGTGQYKLQLPFTPAVGFNHFTGWAWADPNVDPDTGTGHTIINADTAGITDVLDLHYLKSAGGANAAIREGLFLQGTPVTLSTISKIYVNGTYIAQ